MSGYVKLSKRFANIGRKYAAFIKRRTAKFWRRLAKEQLEDAPVKRPVRGWSD